MQEFSPITDEEIKAECEKNVFVRSWNSYYAQDGDPLIDVNYELSVLRCETIQELKEAFMMYDALRQCFVYENLVFVNSTLGGGWEAWTLKKFGNRLIAFESISMDDIARKGTHNGETFEHFIQRLLDASETQCQKLGY